MYKIIDGWMRFDDMFDGSLSDVIFPSNVQKVDLGWYFNQEMHNLPNNLTHLILSWFFNQEMHDLLPNSLTHLKFGFYFNQEMHNATTLPNNLTHLIFCGEFNQDVSHLLPNSLTYLRFGRDFNQDVSKLPKSITYLKFHIFYNSRFNHNLNPYLYHLTEFDIKDTHKQKRLMLERCQINKHNMGIREDKLIDLLLKIDY